MRATSSKSLWVLLNRSLSLKSRIKKGYFRHKAEIAFFCQLFAELLCYDSIVRTNRSARSAIYAKISINSVNSALRDSLYRTFSDTSSASFASISNFVCHNKYF